jgi:hypothetical protein
MHWNFETLKTQFLASQKRTIFYEKFENPSKNIKRQKITKTDYKAFTQTYLVKFGHFLKRVFEILRELFLNFFQNFSMEILKKR